MRHWVGGVCAVLLAVTCARTLIGVRDANGARRASTTPRWTLVFQHNPYLQESTGLDALGSWDQHARPLTHPLAGALNRDSAPALSPDGRLVAFVRSGSHEGLLVTNIRTGETLPLASGYADNPAWSPSGTAIAYSYCARVSASCPGGLYIIPATGGHARRVFPKPGLASWAPDGRRLACLCTKNPPSLSNWIEQDWGVRDRAIWVFDAKGSNRHRLTTWADGVVGAASWSPDGRLIAFTRRCVRANRHDIDCDIAIMHSDGSGKRSLLYLQVGYEGAPSAVDQRLVWSTEGRLFVSESGFQAKIVLLDPRTGALKKLLSPPASASVDEETNGGSDITPGPNGVVGVVTRDVTASLVLVNHDGHVLARRKMPFDRYASLTLHLG